jgi:hypothetical protein
VYIFRVHPLINQSIHLPFIPFHYIHFYSNTLSALCSPLSACAQEEKRGLKAKHHWTWKVRNLRRPHILLRHEGLVDFNNGGLVLPQKTRKQIFLDVVITTNTMDGDAGRLNDAVFTILHH